MGPSRGFFAVARRCGWRRELFPAWAFSAFLVCAASSLIRDGLAQKVDPGTVRDFEVNPGNGCFPNTALTIGGQFCKSSTSEFDVDGDGTFDLACGAPAASRVFVFFMKSDGTCKNYTRIDTNTVPGLFPLIEAGDGFGDSVTFIPDLNGDNIPDLAVGAAGDDDGGTDVGAVWLLFLNRDAGVIGHRKISRTEGGFNGELYPQGTYSLQNYSGFGTSIAMLGIANGRTTIAVGAPYSGSGLVMIIQLVNSPSGTDVVAREPTQIAPELPDLFGALLTPEREFGLSLGALRDLNSDSFFDLAVGARLEGLDTQNTLVDSGGFLILFLDGNFGVLSYQRFDHTNFAGASVSTGDELGSSLQRLSDVDGDQVPDLAVGSEGFTGSRGAVWLCFLTREGNITRCKFISEQTGNFSVTFDNNSSVFFGSSLALLRTHPSSVTLAVGARGEGLKGKGYILQINRESPVVGGTSTQSGTSTTLQVPTTLTFTTGDPPQSTGTTATDPDPVDSDFSSFTAEQTIVLIAAGVIVVLLAAVCLLGYLVWKKRGGGKSTGEDVSLSSANSSFVDTPSTHSGHSAAENLLHSVMIEKQIGEGSFGKVFRGKHKGRKVAVKQVMGGEAEVEVMKELDVMLRLDSPRVVNLYGVCQLPSNHGGGLGLVMEFAALGSLSQHLQGAAESSLDSRALVQISLHVSEGLEYLHSIGLLHRDMAARNVLVVSDGSCKLADFGLARFCEGETYVATSKLPIRWTCPETLRDQVVTRASDCYSLGIVMFEIFSRGKLPFEHLSTMAVYDAVLKGDRPGKPEGCPKAIFKLMQNLWADDPSDRVSAKTAVSTLTRIHKRAGEETSEDGSFYASVFIRSSRRLKSEDGNEGKHDEKYSARKNKPQADDPIYHNKKPSSARKNKLEAEDPIYHNRKPSARKNEQEAEDPIYHNKKPSARKNKLEADDPIYHNAKPPARKSKPEADDQIYHDSPKQVAAGIYHNTKGIQDRVAQNDGGVYHNTKGIQDKVAQNDGGVYHNTKDIRKKIDEGTYHTNISSLSRSNSGSSDSDSDASRSNSRLSDSEESDTSSSTSADLSLAPSSSSSSIAADSRSSSGYDDVPFTDSASNSTSASDSPENDVAASIKGMSIQELRDHLREVGVSDETCEKIFESRIDGAVLGEVTREDLAEIGVSVVGDRLKILKISRALPKTTRNLHKK